MATQGFQLSQFERAPQVPSNIGVVDTKSIYGAVVDALKANEALRTVQQVQATTDAELTLARQKALMETGLLEPEAEARRMRANLLASEAAAGIPNVGTAARARRAADVLAAERAELGVGNVPAEVMAQGAQLGRMQREAEAITPESLYAGVRARTSADTLAARKAEAGLGLVESEAELARAELRQKLAESEILSDPELIRRRVESRSYGGMPAAVQSYIFAQRVLNDPNSTPEQLRAAQIMLRTAPTASSDPMLRAQQSFQVRRGALVGELQMALPKLEGALQTFEDQTANFDRLIDQAVQLVSPYTTGYGVLIDRLPTTDARALNGIVESLQANLGFDTLQEMRNNSPTGGALGNVTDYENRRLSATITSLDPGIDGATFLERLQILREERQKALQRMRNAFNRDRNVVEEFRSEIGMPRTTSAPAPRATSAPPARTFNYGNFKVTILPPENQTP